MTGEDLFFYATINAESESRIWPELSAEEKMIWDTAARYAAAQSPLKHGQCCRCPVVDGPREIGGTQEVEP